MNSPANLPTKNKFHELLERIQHDYPDVHLKRSASFYWSPEVQTIYYNTSDENPMWSLFHELGHMTHNHNTYTSDTRLVHMEVEAWATGAIIAKHYGYAINEDHVQDCLDSYRNWQHARSRCPICLQTGIEKSSGAYGCINCRNEWRVTPNRFCRVYRQTKKP